MKKLCSILIAVILLVTLTPIPTEATEQNSDFLIGDWTTSDGVVLSFHDDGSFTLSWGFFPEENGYWQTTPSSNNAFNIDMEGSSILTLMSAVYGSVATNYHFEILKCNNDNFYLVQVYGDYTVETSSCKLGFTRVGAEENFSYEKTPEAEPEIKDTVKSVTFHWHDKDCTIDLNWDWSYFNKSATTYDHNLAMAGLAISTLIHSPDTFQDQLEDIFGFDNVQYQDYSTWDTPAYALGHHKENFNGKEKHIILVALRGTNLNLNGPNDLINNISSQVDGFRPATWHINDVIEKYTKEKIGCSKENTILFITGHSLGGAVAQSLAPFAEKYTSTDRNCFIYTYAAANAFVDHLKFSSYQNVHNIINTRDPVPSVPILFGKYGRKWYYNSANSKYSPYYEKTYKEDNWKIKGILDEHDAPTYFAMMLCSLPENMNKRIRNPYSITSVHCPVDIEVYDSDGNIMGCTTGDEVSLEETSKVLILAHDGEKEIVAPYEVPYTVRIIGTGDGQMTVIQKSMDMDSEEPVQEKEFENIPVSKGQLYTLKVDGSDAENTSFEQVNSIVDDFASEQDNSTAEELSSESNVSVAEDSSSESYGSAADNLSLEQDNTNTDEYTVRQAYTTSDSSKKDGMHWLKKILLIVSIALSVFIFIIIFLVIKDSRK